MNPGGRPPLFAVAFMLTASIAYADVRPDIATRPGLADATLLIIRHAEKPAKGQGGAGLTPAGEARARAYADYFRQFSLDGSSVRLSALIAATDSANSTRPRLTLKPLSKTTGLPVLQPFTDDQVAALAEWLGKGARHRTILIAWRHHELPALLTVLGADPAALLPGATWPDDTYDWVMVLRYDDQGKLKSAQRLVEPDLLVKERGLGQPR